MHADERIRKLRIIEKMQENEKFCKKVGIQYSIEKKEKKTKES